MAKTLEPRKSCYYCGFPGHIESEYRKKAYAMPSEILLQIFKIIIMSEEPILTNKIFLKILNGTHSKTSHRTFTKTFNQIFQITETKAFKIIL